MLEIAEFIVQLLIAIGMVGAVIVALFKENLRLKFAPPQLTMKILDQGGHKTTVPLTHTGEDGEQKSRSESARYYHLKVENQRRWSTANQVQVFLTRIDTPGPDGNLRLLWVGEIPMRWRFQDSYPVARTIGPSIECDLCSIVKGKWLQLETLIHPQELHDQWREKCHLILHLQARSVEVDSDELRVKVAWDFEWEEGDAEMKNHMIIEDVT